MLRVVTCVVILLVVALTAGPTVAQYGAQNGEWRHYGGDAGSTKYSALEQINRDNVGDLEIAWRWRADNFGPRPEFNSRVTPIVIDGVVEPRTGLDQDIDVVDAEIGSSSPPMVVGDVIDFTPEIKALALPD